MIKCPGCGATLPPAYVRCQFCGADTSSVARPVALPADDIPIYEPYQREAWVPLACSLVSWYFVIDGLWMVTRNVFWPGTAAIVFIIFGAIKTLLSLGLVFKINFARGVVNVVCVLQALSGLWGIFISFVLIPLIHAWALLSIIENIVSVGTALLMIYLIGETDRDMRR